MGCYYCRQNSKQFVVFIIILCLNTDVCYTNHFQTIQLILDFIGKMLVTVGIVSAVSNYSDIGHKHMGNLCYAIFFFRFYQLLSVFMSFDIRLY